MPELEKFELDEITEGLDLELTNAATRTMPRDTYQRLLLEEMHAFERWENRPAIGWGGPSRYP